MKISIDIEVPEGKHCKEDEKFCCEYIDGQFCSIFNIGLWKIDLGGELIFKCGQCYNKGDN